MRDTAGVAGLLGGAEEAGDGHVPVAGGEAAGAGAADASALYNPDAPSLDEAYEPAADDADEYDPDCGRPVSLDIETTDLSRDCKVTCICVWDGAEGRSWVFRPDTMESDLALCVAELPGMLESASLIYAYNGLRFDLPILARWLNLQPLLGDWIRKLVDPLAQASTIHYAHVRVITELRVQAKALFGTRACIKLDNWLLQNALPTKSGSGLEAVEMAKEGRWDELAAYCMRDTELTHMITTRAIQTTAEWQHMRYAPGGRVGVFTSGLTGP